MWGDMSLWNVQGALSGNHIVPRILTVDYTFNILNRQIHARMNDLIYRIIN